MRLLEYYKWGDFYYILFYHISDRIYAECTVYFSNDSFNIVCDFFIYGSGEIIQIRPNEYLKKELPIKVAKDMIDNTNPPVKFLLTSPMDKIKVWHRKLSYEKRIAKINKIINR